MLAVQSENVDHCRRKYPKCHPKCSTLGVTFGVTSTLGVTFGVTSGGTFGVLSLLSWTPNSSLRSLFRVAIMAGTSGYRLRVEVREESVREHLG